MKNQQIKLYFDEKAKNYCWAGVDDCFKCKRPIVNIFFLHIFKIIRHSPVESRLYCNDCIKSAKMYLLNQTIYGKIINTVTGNLTPISEMPFEVGGSASYSSAFDAVKAESEKTIDNTRYALRYESIGGAQIGKNPTEVIEQLDRCNMGTEEGLNFLNNLATATPLIEEKKDAKPIIKSEEERRDIKC
jgi:hypothetical protein